MVVLKQSSPGDVQNYLYSDQYELIKVNGKALITMTRMC